MKLKSAVPHNSAWLLCKHVSHILFHVREQLCLLCMTLLSLLQVSKFFEYVSSVGQTALARIAQAGLDSKVWQYCVNHVILTR